MVRLEAIRSISESLSSIGGIEVYVFGSEARGDSFPDSDIDLLVLLPDSLTIPQRIKMERQIHGILLPIELDYNVEINAVILQHRVWNKRRTPFTINVTKDRIRI